MTVGVLLVRGAHQTDEQVFENKPTANLHMLMNILASKVPARGWTGYTGGQVGLSKHIYYTSWRGFEIVFHVAADMSAEEQRQYVGNDKCIIILAEGADAPVAHFRGNVNSVAIVLRCNDREEAVRYEADHLAQWGTSSELIEAVANEEVVAWRIGVFYRKRIVNFQPLVCTSLVREPGMLRDLVCANVVNGVSATMRSPPYSHAVDSCFAQETEALVNRFLVPEGKRK
jgi:hypothetical protein